MKETVSQPPHICGCDECQASSFSATAKLHASINHLMSELDEKSRRLLSGLLARQLGHGGIQTIARITGLDRKTIRRGRRELAEPDSQSLILARRPGGGRQRVEKKNLRSS